MGEPSDSTASMLQRVPSCNDFTDLSLVLAGKDLGKQSCVLKKEMPRTSADYLTAGLPEADKTAIENTRSYVNTKCASGIHQLIGGTKSRYGSRFRDLIGRKKSRHGDSKFSAASEWQMLLEGSIPGAAGKVASRTDLVKGIRTLSRALNQDRLDTPLLDTLRSQLSKEDGPDQVFVKLKGQLAMACSRDSATSIPELSRTAVPRSTAPPRSTAAIPEVSSTAAPRSTVAIPEVSSTAAPRPGWTTPGPESHIHFRHLT